MSEYHHLFSRVEYPREHGYRMETTPLPDWIHLTVMDDGESKRLTVHSRIHMNKEVVIEPSYSRDLSDQDIIKDLSGEISSRFL